MTKAELVAMDEDFIQWLASGNINYNSFKDKQFVLILENSEGVVTTHGCDSIEEVKNQIKNSIEEADAGWEVTSLFDLLQKQKINFSVEVVVLIQGYTAD